MSASIVIPTRATIPVPPPDNRQRFSNKRGRQARKPSERACEVTRHLEWMNTSTGELGNLTCKRATRCTSCALRKAYATSALIHQARPTHFVTIKLLPGEPDADHKVMAKMRKRLNRRGVEFEWAWVIEENRFNTGTHAHAYVRAHQGIDQEVWENVAEGIGVELHVQDHLSTPGGSRYGLKSILRADPDYVEAEVFCSIGMNDSIDSSADTAVALHLLRNGGRLVHASRGFWMDADGHASTLTKLLRGLVNVLRRAASAAHDVIVYPSRYRDQIVRELRKTHRSMRASYRPQNNSITPARPHGFSRVARSVPRQRPFNRSDPGSGRSALRRTGPSPAHLAAAHDLSSESAHACTTPITADPVDAAASRTKRR
ncbi:MAG: hypothetical protein ACI9OJ_006016 [Myxococcota bacterium]